METRCVVPAMGTLLSIRAWGAAAVEAVREAVWEAHRLETLWSRFRPDSEVSRLMAQAGQWVPVAPETRQLLLSSLEMHELTGGAFDITLGGGATGALEHSGGMFRLAPGAQLDLGGIGKGAAVARLIQLLQLRGVRAALVNFGESSIGVIGSPPTREAWRIGIRSPGGGSAATLELTAGSLSTSGDYEQTSAQYNHVVDPSTHRAADSNLRSATVLTADPVRAEALSTAMLVLGAAHGLALQATLGGFDTVLIDHDGHLTSTVGRRDRSLHSRV